jgi:hypothetical protein
MLPNELRALSEPPPGSPALQALWWAARGDWQRAHECAQADEGGPADWVHAYLHRVEGDLPNARYWYARAGKPAASGPFEAEWDSIAQSLLA